jgi:hypothetical protein
VCGHLLSGNHTNYGSFWSLLTSHVFSCSDGCQFFHLLYTYTGAVERVYRSGKHGLIKCSLAHNSQFIEQG